MQSNLPPRIVPGRDALRLLNFERYTVERVEKGVYVLKLDGDEFACCAASRMQRIKLAMRTRGIGYGVLN